MASPLLSLVAVAVIFTILVDLNSQAYYIIFLGREWGGKFYKIAFLIILQVADPKAS
jgi:hypothetical protein